MEMQQKDQLLEADYRVNYHNDADYEHWHITWNTHFHRGVVGTQAARETFSPLDQT